MVPLRDIVNVTARDGDYASETEVIAAALALLRDEVDGLAAIKAAIEQGEASGEPQPFDFDEFLQDMHRRS